MSLGKNSLVAAYQGKGQLKSRPSGTSVVTFIGGNDGGIRYPTRKRLTGYGGYEIQRETVWQVSMFKCLVRIRYPAGQRLIQRQCGLQEAADEHFFVQQETCLALWCRDKETLANAKRLYSS